MDYHNAIESAWLNGYRQGRESVEKSGPIDVAIVVRCKDCEYTNGQESVFCPGHLACNRAKKNQLLYVKPDDFCSYGERRSDAK